MTEPTDLEITQRVAELLRKLPSAGDLIKTGRGYALDAAWGQYMKAPKPRPPVPAVVGYQARGVLYELVPLWLMLAEAALMHRLIDAGIPPRFRTPETVHTCQAIRDAWTEYHTFDWGMW